MKKWKILQLLGLCLILGSCLLLLGSRWLDGQYAARAEELAERLLTQLPPRTPGVEESYTDPHMPLRQVEGEDFCAVLEIPDFGVKLPVGGNRNAEDAYPSRLGGSAYDGSLIICGPAHQFSFAGTIDQGSVVRLTDMTGMVFTYTVTWVDRAKQADAAALTARPAALTLVTRDPYSLNYLLIRCE